ncbi:MAG TPA: cytochrome c family protein [Vicinamibacterales bacterium]|nr:cytochrome c family protein [Vicinamibacterales bacterium]
MRILLSIVLVCGTSTLTLPSAARESGPEPPAAGAQQPAAPADYVWAPTCQKCHAEIYESWANTKHARALNRLSVVDQGRECIGCHVTGPKGRVEQDGKAVNAGVQCESCHGPGAAHAADPAVKTGLVRRPAEAVCTACHNDRSPSFRGFFFDAMWPLSHRLK